jgi:RHH-type proline utilization regulon transcriptional repressor/proline dehydrogenase/delta 1-pyrroline-5-carboxylate dehydrogenase
MAELLPRVKKLAVMARTDDIGLNIDAEEADRLELSLDILEALALDRTCRAGTVWALWFRPMANGAPMFLTGSLIWRAALDAASWSVWSSAYWDSEIKKAQVEGLEDFPVYTRKVHTDVSYIACARKLLGARDAVFPNSPPIMPRLWPRSIIWRAKISKSVIGNSMPARHGRGFV